MLDALKGGDRRILIAAILAAALTASPTQTLPLQTGDVRCDEVVVQDASFRAGKLSKLAELPPARQELAVNRDRPLQHSGDRDAERGGRPRHAAQARGWAFA
jgi:hypothetical protein